MRYLQYGSDKYGQPIKILNTSRRYEGFTLDGSTVSGTTPTTGPRSTSDTSTADVSEVTLWGVLAVFTLLFILTTFWK